MQGKRFFSRRFKNPELRVTFTSPAPQLVGEALLPDKSVHKWLCDNNYHANNIIQDVIGRKDPFQRHFPIPLAQVLPEAERLNASAHYLLDD